MCMLAPLRHDWGLFDRLCIAVSEPCRAVRIIVCVVAYVAVISWAWKRFHIGKALRFVEFQNPEIMSTDPYKTVLLITLMCATRL